MNAYNKALCIEKFMNAGSNGHVENKIRWLHATNNESNIK